MATFEYQFLGDDDGALNQPEFEKLFNDLGADEDVPLRVELG